MGLALKAFQDAMKTGGAAPSPVVKLTEAQRAEVLRVFTRALPQPEPTLLEKLAPVIDSPTSPAMLKLLGKIKSTSLDEIARTQAEELAPLWSAFEESNDKIKPLPNAGREDIPFTREGMETLARDIARYLHIAQTQLPVIVPMRGDINYRLEQKIKETPALQDVKVSVSFISGGEKRLFETFRGRNAQPPMDSNFGFMSVRKEETSVLGAKSHKLVALPVFGLDEKMLNFAVSHPGGKDMLADFQQMIGVINHDYFHHLTARIITPYFDGSDANLLKIRETPLGTLLGPGETRAGLEPKTGHVNAFTALKAESTMQFGQRYKRDPSLQFKSGDSYEFHSLHLHAAIYQDKLHEGPLGDKMLQRLHSYFARLNAMTNSTSLEFNKNEEEAQNAQAAKIYYGSLIYNNLLRIVPHSHKLAQECEKLIDELDISTDLVRKSVASRLMRGDQDEDNRRIREAVEGSGVPMSEIGDQMKDFKVSELLRWENYLINAGDLNLLHAPEAKEPRERALPAMREFLSVVKRDVQLAKWRGGIETYEILTRPKTREPG